MNTSHKIKLLEVAVNGQATGQLLHHSVYEFRYLNPEGAEDVALLMPPSRPTYQDGDLFPVMDQNLPEGDLFMRLRQVFPKQAITPMQLLAWAGHNGIGRLGFSEPGRDNPPKFTAITRDTLLRTRFTPGVFDNLVTAYLSTGSGIAGMQPKIMVPDRATVPIPNLIVKTGSTSYPGLAANEYLCLTAAACGGIQTPVFDLSDDGEVLVLDRFDMTPDGNRLGFEDIAALMGLRVRDVLSDRKYQGSYERVASVLKMLRLPQSDLTRFFEQVALSALVRNGDGHLKNFGVLYRSATDLWLAPLFDVVTTTIYTYTRYPGGPELEDRTMALKLFAGKHHTRTYPTDAELETFGREVCGVDRPAQVLARLREGMHQAMTMAQSDERIPRHTRAAMFRAWSWGDKFEQVYR